MKIRPATAEDAEAIAALNAEVQAMHAAALPHLFKEPGRNGFSTTVASEILAQPDSRVLVADEGGKAVGYLYAQVVRRPETPLRHALDLVYVHHIAVRRTHRRRGCGEALLQRALALAREEGIARLELDVWSFNAAARAFFRRQGFAAFNERMCIEVGRASDEPMARP